MTMKKSEMVDDALATVRRLITAEVAVRDALEKRDRLMVDCERKMMVIHQILMSVEDNDGEA